MANLLLPNHEYISVAALREITAACLVTEVNDVDARPDRLWAVDEEVQAGHDGVLTVIDLTKLAAFETGVCCKGGDLTDEEAMDLLHYMLSAPEWSVSYLEDARAIIARTNGRWGSRKDDVKGAQWASH
jgi:hypothetical protein